MGSSASGSSYKKKKLIKLSKNEQVSVLGWLRLNALLHNNNNNRSNKVFSVWDLDSRRKELLGWRLFLSLSLGSIILLISAVFISAYVLSFILGLIGFFLLIIGLVYLFLVYVE